MKKVLFFLVSMTASFAFAGGAGAGPEIGYQDLVSCRPVGATQAGIQELVYFQRSETQFGRTLENSGVSISGSQFEATIYATVGHELHGITAPQNNPGAVDTENAFAVDFNLRQMGVKTKGRELTLSLVGGALGNIAVKNLRMTCASAN